MSRATEYETGDTVTADEYVPDEDEVRQAYADQWVEDEPGRSAEFDRFLARVRRDARAEALDGLIAWHRETAQDAGTPAPIRRGIAVMADEAQRYRDTRCPEETP